MAAVWYVINVKRTLQQGGDSMKNRIEEIRKELADGSKTSGGASSAMDFDYHGHMYHVDNLARAIRNGEALILDGKDGRLAVEFIQAVYESSRTGMPVTLR